MAPPEVAAIYAALRQASGVPLVNLIWRHLATLPGALPWAWTATRPVLEDGSAAAARQRLSAALPLPALGAGGLARLGLSDATRPAVAALVETYNRGNLTNLIVLTALRRAHEGAAPGPARAGTAAAAAEDALAPVPPLPSLAALPEATRAAVLALAARHGEDGVVPSLYLHLAHWPALPAALLPWLDPVLSAPVRTAGRDAAIALATAEADALRPCLGAEAGTPPHGQAQAVLAALRRFTLQVIPEMVPIGLALARALRG
jgi:hypothetical protein